MKKEDININKLNYLYNFNNFTRDMLIKYFNTSKRIINDIIADNNIKKYTKRERLGITKEVLYDLYIEKNLSQKEIHKKYNISKATFNRWLKKYGLHKSSEKRLEITKKTNKDKYGVEHTTQLDSVKNKMKKTCLNKYGVENYKQKHIKNLNIWNDNKLFYKWVKNTYNKLGRKVCSGDVAEFFNIADTVTGVSKLRLLDNIKGSKKYYNIQESYYENLIIDWLKINNINYKRNDRTIIKPYELDFVLPDYNIAIEMNDTKSHSIQSKMEYDGYDYLDALYYHETKLKLAKKEGYFLVHIYDKDLNDLDSILKPLLKNKPKMDEINSKVYWVKGKKWVYDDDVINLSDEGYVMMVVSNWYL